MKSSSPLKIGTFGLLILSATLALCGPAAAQLTLPKLETGRHIYTIPPDFDPPLIGKAGIQEIEAAADKLHYPYFVVLVQDLPGGTDQAAASLIDGFAEDWTTRFAGIYDPLRSQIFVLTFNPRKFRFLAGGQFKNALGFEREAHTPYTDIFVKSVSGTPKDPKSGIINMMQAVDDYLYDHTDPQRIAKRKTIRLILLLLLGLLVLAIVGLIRFLMLKSRRKAFQTEWATWNEKLQNAYQQFAMFDAETRDTLLSLKDMEGETRQLYDTVTAEVDEITLSLGALQAHLDACKAKADSATLLNSRAVSRARDALNQPFDYDTRKANTQDLFGTPTVVLHLKIEDFMDQLRKRYTTAKLGWNRLKKAAEAAWQPPQEALPPGLAARFEAVPEKLRVGLEHPLLPASKAAALYQELEALRWKEALTYASRIEAIQQEHRQLIERLSAVEADLKEVADAEAFQAQTYSQLVLAPEDRPETLLERARSFHRDLKQALEAGVAFEQLQPQISRTLEAYRAFQALETEIGQALSGLPGKLKALGQSFAEIEALQRAVVEEIEIARRYHRHADFAAEQAQTGQAVQQAQADLEGIREAEQAHRSLDAWRQALELEERLQTVRSDFEAIQAICEELATQKKIYEETLLNLQQEAEESNRRMAGYGHSTHFVVPLYQSGGVYDYNLLLSEAQTMQQQWSSSVSEAAAAHEAEIERQNASSSSSSSSSSWSSSSDSSSSGGSWDSSSS
ncbi:MAG: hypothetical protein ACAI44_13065, partial [Candidatus Sericytochromatia bacterium]